MGRSKLQRSVGAKAQNALVNSDAALWLLVKSQYPKAVQATLTKLGRGPTLKELSMIELAEHMAGKAEVVSLKRRAARAKTVEVRTRYLYEARQVAKTLAKMRESMRHLRKLAGADGNVSRGVVPVPAGVAALSVVPDFNVDEELVG